MAKYRFKMQTLWVAKCVGMATCYGTTPKNAHEATLAKRRAIREAKESMDHFWQIRAVTVNENQSLRSQVRVLQRDLAIQRAKPAGDDFDAEAWVMMAMALHGEHDPTKACKAMAGLVDVTPREMAAAVRLRPHIQKWMAAFPVGPDGLMHADKRHKP